MRLSSYGQLVVLHFVRSELHVGDGPRLYRYLSAIAFALKCMTQMSLHYQYESQVGSFKLEASLDSRPHSRVFGGESIAHSKR